MNPVNISVALLLISIGIGYWGRNYRFGFWGYFFASLLLTPPVGILLVIASSPGPGERKNSTSESDG